MHKNTILLVDDEPGIRFGIRNFLEALDYAVVEAGSCREAEEQCRTHRLDAAILDYSLPDGNAISLLARIKEIIPLPIVILTGYGTIELAVQAIKDGAEHFLTKPVELPALSIILQRMIDNQRHRRANLAGKSRQDRKGVHPFRGSSRAIQNLAQQAEKVAATDSPVLIQGETGTGKGVLAAWLHANSARNEEPFVDLNCAGLSSEFLETELFGHEKGAFTSAVAQKQGLLEVAHRGTVFLDEIGDMDPQVQPKLLKVLEEKKFRRLGEIRDRQVDIRLIAATHQDLNRAVREKRFRSDLYFRISTIPLVVPPLRERREDIPELARFFLAGFTTDLGRPKVEFTPEALEGLCAYHWPGNIRELRNVVERAVLLGDRNRLGVRDLMFDHADQAVPPDNTVHFTLEELEHYHIQRILKLENNRVEQAAARLGIPRSTLYQKIKKLQLPNSN
ncbi:MAG: sigma-54 dependent transcriptional regulator [Blastocatellia bacterium]|nr:sigma-54 dependent transcriptional regulator [Blastocatellia bacterium]